MPGPLVLCYHALSDDWPATLSTTPALFEAQLALLLGRGYRAATFAEAVAAPGDHHVFAVTFDDAYRSVLERAEPIMRRLGVPGTVFVPTNFAGTQDPMAWPGIDQWVGGPYENELLCLGWDELRGLAGAGWEVGSHTCSHPHLTAIDDASLARELGDSRAAMEEGMGEPCRSIAYPYGDVDERVVEAAGAAGYERGASLPDWFGSKAPLDWPRVGVYHRDGIGRFRLKVAPPVRRLLASTTFARAATAVNPAKRA